MSQQVLAPNVATSLVNVKKIIIGVGWDVKPNPHHDASTPPIDLDASITCFDAMGQFVDSIYFGNLMNANRSIVHTGDNKSGVGEGHDEEIIMQLDQIPAPTCICVLTIHSYSGETFEGVQRAFVRVMNADTRPELEMGMFSLSASGPYTSMIMGKFYRSPADGSWIFHTIGAGAHGRSFGATLPIIQGYLRDLIPNIVINPTPNIVVMTKGESVPISKDPSVPISRVTFALGWDMMGTEPIDLDGSCVLFDSKAQNTEAVYFNHKQSNNGAIRHSGDDRSGDGDDDDELIFVDLPQIPSNVTSLFFIVNSYSAHRFSRIKNAYVRIIEGFNPMGTELMRFSLSEATGSAMDATAMIMCKLYRRADGQWMCKALGYAAEGRTWNENIADMTKEIMGRLPPQPDGFRFQPVPPRKQRPQQQQQQQFQQQQPVDACCTML